MSIYSCFRCPYLLDHFDKLKKDKLFFSIISLFKTSFNKDKIVNVNYYYLNMYFLKIGQLNKNIKSII